MKYTNLVYKSSLIHGYLESDGSVYKHTKGYVYTEFTSINLSLLEGIQDILFSLGIIGSISELRDSGIMNIQGRDVNTKNVII